MFSTLLGKAGLTLLLVTVCFVSLAIVARNWSCRKPRPPRPPKIVTAGPYGVVAVPTGASVTVQAGRRGRTLTIRLIGVAAPASGPMAQVSADHLRGLAGATITVQYERRGLLRGEDETDDAPEARVPDAGIVFGASGVNTNLEQVKAGLASCHQDAPDEWKATEKIAKKSGLGMWK